VCVVCLCVWWERGRERERLSWWCGSLCVWMRDRLEYLTSVFMRFWIKKKCVESESCKWKQALLTLITIFNISVNYCPQKTVKICTDTESDSPKSGSDKSMNVKDRVQKKKL
jgi:hypothetical protein